MRKQLQIVHRHANLEDLTKYTKLKSSTDTHETKRKATNDYSS